MAAAFQVQSQQELGRGEAKNQNVVVRCTTPDGQLSNQTCHLRRHVRCNGTNCNNWHPWRDLRNPGASFNDWRAAATACCNARGLR